MPHIEHILPAFRAFPFSFQTTLGVWEVMKALAAVKTSPMCIQAHRIPLSGATDAQVQLNGFTLPR